MGFLQRDYWPCPFCDKGIIELLVRPTTYVSSKQSGGKGGRATVKRKVESQTVVISQTCSVCGKTNEEITKKLKEDESI